MADEKRVLERCASDLLRTEARLMRQTIETLQGYGDESVPDYRTKALNTSSEIVKYIDYLATFIVDATIDRSKEEALIVLDLLVTSVECLSRLGFRNTTAELDLLKKQQLQAERARNAIVRKPKAFYDQIVADVLHEHVAENGEWKGKPMRLAQLLGDIVNQRTEAGGGETLKDDTIYRKLKVLLRPPGP